MAERVMPYKVRGPLTELTFARIRELTREPEAVFWVFVFPILLSAILALAFRSKPPDALPVAVVAGPHAEARLAALSAGSDLKASILSPDEAKQALARGRVVLVVSADEAPSYSYDPTQPESRAARLAVDARLQKAAGRADAFTPGQVEVTEPGGRYVDFLVPGLLGMASPSRAASTWTGSGGCWRVGSVVIAASPSCSSISAPNVSPSSASSSTPHSMRPIGVPSTRSDRLS